MPTVLDFVEKEGKYFAPIVSEEPVYRISPDQNNPGTGAIQTRDNVYVEPDGANTQQKSGSKGVFARIRFVSSDTTKNELFAVNTQWFQSSN